MEYLAEAVDSTISTYCVSDFSEEWDVEGLVNEVKTLWPTSVTEDDLADLHSTDELYDRLMGEATGYYETREADLGPETMREVERQVMLQIIDTKWREHLYEMDYLQEGIHLRAYGQKDPLVEWQREGFSMFGEMMKGISQDFVKYVMHAQISVAEQPAKEAAVSEVSYSAPSDPSEAGSGMAAAARAEAAAQNLPLPVGSTPQMPQAPEEDEVQKPVVKSEWDKTPRNAPCPCGSGKKFKTCHGAS
jgi:preprotein translocase subunit SecA